MQFDIKDPNAEDNSGGIEDGNDSLTSTAKKKAKGAFDAGIIVDSTFDPSTLSFGEKEELQVELAASIKKISKKGVISMTFSHEMRIPSNYQELFDKYLSADPFYRKQGERKM